MKEDLKFRGNIWKYYSKNINKQKLSPQAFETRNDTQSKTSNETIKQ